jgi:hypothetical protein
MNDPRRDAEGADGLLSTIDSLACLLASERLSIAEKIHRLRQSRYDMLLLEIGATEGFGAQRLDGGILGEITKVLLHLEHSPRCH